HRDVRMKKLLVASVCVIALTVGAQAKPIQQTVIDNRWVSAPIQPGNSGGPLLDMNGRVIGMAQGILGTLRAAEALGGAIPQNVNFGITTTTIIGFLQAHSVDYRIDTERTKFEPEQIAEEAKKFTVKPAACPAPSQPWPGDGHPRPSGPRRPRPSPALTPGVAVACAQRDAYRELVEYCWRLVDAEGRLLFKYPSRHHEPSAGSLRLMTGMSLGGA